MTLIISLVMILFPTIIGHDMTKEIIFWNVGQGQWITSTDLQHCYHFDVGGEDINTVKIRQTCSKRNNLIFYSHWDWDHIGLTLQLKKAVAKVCIAVPPQGHTQSYKLHLLSHILPCPEQPYPVEKINFDYRKAKTANDFSQIFIYRKYFLITGDSPKKMEKVWAKLIPHTIRWFSVSHHGSKSGTSDDFLKTVKNAHLAVASARRKVYGHPHPAVTKRMKKFGIALLRTEDWGNIHIIVSF